MNAGSAEAVVVIPARYGSTRLPGKPLVEVAGRALIRRVWEIAQTVPRISEVYVATDDDRIAEAVKAFGGKAIMTSPDCRNGTERVAEAVASLSHEPDLVVNMQGDAVLTPPQVVEAVVDLLLAAPEAPLCTVATRLTREQFERYVEQKDRGVVGGTFAVVDRDLNALYFSKSPIPYMREWLTDVPPPLFRHIGIYGFRLSALNRFVALAPTPLERMEGLEQLRALENGWRIRVAEVDLKGRTLWSIDSPEDVKIAEELISKEGEVVPT